MNLGLKDTHIVVAGASRGIGLGIAHAFAKEEAQVWLAARGEHELDKTAAALNNAPHTACDLTKSEGRLRLVEEINSEWGKLDTLILNLGGVTTNALNFESTDQEWLEMFQLNFFAQTALIRDFKPLLSKSPNASIVAISSIVGETRLAAPLSYSTAKAALNHLCGTSAKVLAEAGIRFNIVSPGNIVFEGGRWEQKMKTDTTAIKQMLDSTVPMKRFGTPAEIASFVVFLASKQASFCTGTVIRVDGGQSPVT